MQQSSVETQGFKPLDFATLDEAVIPKSAAIRRRYTPYWRLTDDRGTDWLGLTKRNPTEKEIALVPGEYKLQLTLPDASHSSRLISTIGSTLTNLYLKVNLQVKSRLESKSSKTPISKKRGLLFRSECVMDLNTHNEIVEVFSVGEMDLPCVLKLQLRSYSRFKRLKLQGVLWRRDTMSRERTSKQPSQKMSSHRRLGTQTQGRSSNINLPTKSKGKILLGSIPGSSNASLVTNDQAQRPTRIEGGGPPTINSKNKLLASPKNLLNAAFGVDSIAIEDPNTRQNNNAVSHTHIYSHGFTDINPTDTMNNSRIQHSPKTRIKQQSQDAGPLQMNIGTTTNHSEQHEASPKGDQAHFGKSLLMKAFSSTNSGDLNQEETRSNNTAAVVGELQFPNLQVELTEFYKVHAPEKLGDIAMLLNVFRGREQDLVASIRAKYGVSFNPTHVTM